jgi:peptidoglycan/xylan/chitin deacetylase (PgdA/CDA1 family)
VHQHEATTTVDQPPPPGASLGRRGALKAAAALAIAAVPVAACEPDGHHPGTAAAGRNRSAGQVRHDPAAPGPVGGGAATATPLASGPAGSADAAPAPGASGAPTGPALPPEVTNGPRDRPNVALTFHGQGDPAQVRALLGELEQGGARATVLAVGSWLETAPELAKRILDGGHELGNHTQNHLDLASMGPTDAFNEISACAAVLRRLSGSIGTWFRPSQTQHATPTIQAQAARVGYATCLSYDLDSLDNTDPGAQAVTRTVAGAVANGSIISMHCGHPGTVAAIPTILELLHERGLRPVTMSELVAR